MYTFQLFYLFSYEFKNGTNTPTQCRHSQTAVKENVNATEKHVSACTLSQLQSYILTHSHTRFPRYTHNSPQHTHILSKAHTVSQVCSHTFKISATQQHLLVSQFPRYDGTHSNSHVLPDTLVHSQRHSHSLLNVPSRLRTLIFTHTSELRYILVIGLSSTRSDRTVVR